MSSVVARNSVYADLASEGKSFICAFDLGREGAEVNGTIATELLSATIGTDH